MKYTLTAIALSPLWLAALSLSPGAKSVGIPPFGRIIHGGMTEVFSLPIAIVYLLFPAISLGLALTFRGWLVSCEGKERILPSLVLPSIAALIFTLACGVASHMLRESPNGGFFGAACFTVIYLVISSWIIFPLGIFSHACLLSAYRSDQRKTRTRQDRQGHSRA